MAAIYIHIPFCKRLCGYCDFFKSVKVANLPRVVERINHELIEQRDYLKGEGVSTLYFGGGTPSLVPLDDIGHLISTVRENFDADQLREVTIEVNPDDVTLDYLKGLKRYGVNRLSIGIQSFDDSLLQLMNRRHTAAQAVECVEMAQSVGFDNITIDLIFGVDGFGVESLRRSVEIALSLGVQHISAYHLTIEANTPFARKVARGQMGVVDESISEQQYLFLEQELTAAGFDHYEVSNYALPGFRSSHNSSYWQGVHYLGVGPGAHSFNGVERRWVEESVESYLECGAIGYSRESLTPRDRYNEFVMTSLRCCEGVDLSQLESQFPGTPTTFFKEASASWLTEGKMELSQGRIFIPTRHFLLSDSIIESLFLVADL